MLRVIRGDATPEEIAAIVAVLTLRSQPAAPEPSRTLSIWADKGRMMREPVLPSSGGWRRSAFPR
jgi:Acyl-CoA carboxylase epsilon subunit